MDALDAIPRAVGASYGGETAAPDGTLRAVVAADEEATRARLCEVIRRSQAGLELVEDAQGVAELAAGADEVDVAVVDAGTKQHERLREARRRFPDVLLIAVVPTTERHRIRRAVVDGADGVILREAIEQTLEVTVKAARAGQIVVPGDIRASMAAVVRPLLSTREKQVLGMVVMGFTNGEIARKLVLAESTIKSHLSSAFTKLGVRSRSEAAALILDSDSGLGTGILTISGEGRSDD